MQLPVDFLAWATRYVDQLDPVSPTPHNADMTDENLRLYGNDEAMRQTLSRLLGRHWQEAKKIGESSGQSVESESNAWD